MKLSIIIVSYNTKDLTEKTIGSVNENTRGLEYELIVVDNASDDGSFEMLEAFLKRKKINKLIKNKINSGFAKANNQGIKKANGDYFLLLNSDTRIEDNVLGETVKWMSRNKEVGIASCKLLNEDGTIQGTGGYFPTPFRVFAWMFFIDDLPFLDMLIKPFHPMHENSLIYKGEEFYKKEKELDWVTGAFFLFRKEIVDEVGLFDEDYFMYTEETDYCYRAKELGWKVYYLPQWKIVHLGKASSTKEFPILSEYKGVKLFYKKHYGSLNYIILRVLLKAGAVLRMALFGLLKGKEAFNTYAKAYKIA